MLIKSTLKSALHYANMFLGLFLFRIGRTSIANVYIRGNGLELGALHNPLPVTKRAKVKYVDRMDVDDLRQQYPELNNEKLVHVDIVDDGEHLHAVADSTQDFLIANHFLEHCENPILALINMLRVLKPSGVIYLAVPDKRFTFDVDREPTDIEHLMRDYEAGPQVSRRSHFEEWVRLVSKVENAEDAIAETDRLLQMDYSIHYHVWSHREMLELLLHLEKMLSFEIELFLKNNSELIFILRKISGSEPSFTCSASRVL